MSTTKNYNFDSDTKRYVSLVNSYRLISGFPKLKVEDVVDIDNFCPVASGLPRATVNLL